MHRALLSIGSNTNARLNLEQAIEDLKFYFPTIQFTETTVSEPFGSGYSDPFLNILAYMQTEMAKEELIKQFKAIEKRMGRLPSHKREGKVLIDIDLIKWDNQILKPDDFKRDYMQTLMLQICKRFKK